MVNKFLLLEESVMIVIVLILIRQRNLSAIQNFFVFIIILAESEVYWDILCWIPKEHYR